MDLADLIECETEINCEYWLEVRKHLGIAADVVIFDKGGFGPFDRQNLLDEIMAYSPATLVISALKGETPRYCAYRLCNLCEDLVASGRQLAEEVASRFGADDKPLGNGGSEHQHRTPRSSVSSVSSLTSPTPLGGSDKAEARGLDKVLDIIGG